MLCFRLGTMNGGHEYHGVYIHKDKLYIVGGITPGSFLGGYKSIEVWDIHKGTSQRVECLKYSDVWISGCISNVVCCSTPGHDDSLIIYGPWESRDVCRHTLQVWSFTKHVVTHCITIPQDSYGSVYCVLHVANDRLLLIAEDYTALCRYEDIISNNPQNIRFCHNFKVPNYWCAVSLTEKQLCVMLHGGRPRRGNPNNYVYKALVVDIMNDTQCGWGEVDTPWPLGECQIRPYDTMEIEL